MIYIYIIIYKHIYKFCIYNFWPNQTSSASHLWIDINNWILYFMLKFSTKTTMFLIIHSEYSMLYRTLFFIIDVSYHNGTWTCTILNITSVVEVALRPDTKWAMNAMLVRHTISIDSIYVVSNYNIFGLNWIMTITMETQMWFLGLYTSSLIYVQFG